MRTWNAGVAGGKVVQRGRGRQVWTQEHLDRLVELARRGASATQIGLELRRSATSVRVKASRLGIALVGHEVKQGARRQARREGTVAEAELGTTRKRATVKITVDFDLSSLTRTERHALAERLAAIAEAEGEAARAPKVGEHHLRGGRLPSDAITHAGGDEVLQAAADALEWEERLEVATEAAADFAAGLRDELEERRRADERREALFVRCLERMKGVQPTLVALHAVESELAQGDDPLIQLERAEDEERQWRASVELRALVAIREAVEHVMGPPPYRPPRDDEGDRIRRAMREREAQRGPERGVGRGFGGLRGESAERFTRMMRQLDKDGRE
jgi:hypothetical protein